METKKFDILDQLGKDPGFRVPENYFEQFNEQMANSLPEITITEADAHVSMWVKMRPFIYLAAIFAGVWVMITVFNMTTGSDPSKGKQAEMELKEGIMSPSTQQTASPSILNYQDSVNNNLKKKD